LRYAQVAGQALALLLTLSVKVRLLLKEFCVDIFCTPCDFVLFVRLTTQEQSSEHHWERSNVMIRAILSSGVIRRLVIMALAATLAAPLSVAAFTSTGAAQATNTYNLETGFGKGETQEGFPSQGVPLLKSFLFTYVTCAKTTPACLNGKVDNHIYQIIIKPNSVAQNQILLGFQDEDPTQTKDLYYYQVEHYVLPDSSKIKQYDTGFRTGGKGPSSISRPTPAVKYVFVLLGFQLRFSGNDHHMNEVGIRENNGKVTATFADIQGAPSPPFQYRIWYAYVPRDMFSRVGETSGTRARGSQQVNIPPGPAVIRGFHFDYYPYFTNKGDMHLKRIGVVTRYDPNVNPDGKLKVSYADQDSVEGFDWQVRWGILSHQPQPQPQGPP
jgi:hypothetical protein